MSDATERWARIAALFDELVELDGAERDQRIDAIARDDAELADDVRSLLAADIAEGSLLESDAASVLPGILAQSGDVQSGDVLSQGNVSQDNRVGVWRLLRPIGEGGMGVVWLAERTDGAYEQQVAIKVLKRGMDTHAILRRFLQERRILARLHQPHIVRLIDGGMTADGRPFYVMDHVDGEPITRHASQRALDVRARVALMIDVAEAVSYAHAQLVVHRDLKPSNVLVDRTGAPRVLDFGIAKLIEESGEETMTGTGMRVLSPAYAAPEQILGEAIGTPTDVYALGLMLCELVTGQLPLKRHQATPAQLANDAMHETTERASTLAAQADPERMREMYGADGDARRLVRTLSGDLDVVVATALQREPSRRYATAAAFADDLRRWLDGRPIAARADSAGYRLRKFVRRHRLGVAAAAIIALSLIGGLGAALWQAKLAREEAGRADHERTLAERQLQRTQQVKDFVLTLFREQDPISRAKAQARTSSELIRDGVHQIDTTLAKEPELQAELLRDLGEIQISLGDRKEARATLKKAWDQQKALTGESSAETADAQATYATALVAAGDTGAGESLLRPALVRLRETLGPDHLKTIAAEISLVRVDSLAGKFDEALPLQQHAVKVYSQVHGGESMQAAGQLNALGSLQLQMTHYDESLATSREALRIIELNNGPDHVRAATAHAQIADVLRYQRRYAEALPEIEAAVRIARAQLPARHPLLAQVLGRLGDLLRRMSRYDEAEKVFAEGLDILAGLKTGEHAQLLEWSAALAAAHGNFDLAAERYKASFETFHAALGDSLHTWLTAMQLADSLVDAGHLAEAEKVAIESNAAISRIAAVDSYDQGYADAVIGRLRFFQGRSSESVGLIRHALAIMRVTYGEDHVETAYLRLTLARSLLAMGDQASLSEGLKLVALALPIAEKADPPSPRLGEIYLVRADLRLRASDRDGARADVSQARPLLTGVGRDQDQAREHVRVMSRDLAIK